MHPVEKVEFHWTVCDYGTDSYNDLDEIAAFAAEDIETFQNTRQKLRLELEDARDNDPLWGAFA